MPLADAAATDAPQGAAVAAASPAVAGAPGGDRCYAVVPCAGSGTRAGTAGPKQYARLDGKSLVAHTCAALAGVGRLTATLVVLHPLDTAFEAEVPGFDGWVLRDGGSTRAASVARGLAHLEGRGARLSDWVLVHDAARCLVRTAWIDALIDACRDDPVGGLLALPVADTLKAEEGGRVVRTIDRRATWAAQTPQMFRLGTLRRALEAAGDTVTDEAGAIEAIGLAPKLVAGSLENLKVTWPADFDLAERLLRSRRSRA